MKLFASVIFKFLLPGILCTQNVNADFPKSFMGKNLEQNTIRVNFLIHPAEELQIACSESRLALAQETLDLSTVIRYKKVSSAPILIDSC